MHTGLNRPRRLAFFFPPDPPAEGGGGGTGGGGGSSAPPAGGGGQTDRGFPEGTHVADMTDAQQAAYWKFHSRKHEERYNQLGDITELQRKAAAHDAAEAAKATDVEKARQEGEEAGKAAATAAHRAELAEYALRGALGTLTDERRDAVLAAVDFSKFVGDNGRPDDTKIKAFVATVVAPTDTGSGAGGGHGGHRPPGKGSSVASGADRYRERHGKRSDT